MLHKPNHAHQDDLWLPLSEENSSTFLCQARLGSWPQTLDPLLTPGSLGPIASVGGGRGTPPLGSPLPALRGCPQEGRQVAPRAA